MKYVVPTNIVCRIASRQYYYVPRYVIPMIDTAWSLISQVLNWDLTPTKVSPPMGDADLSKASPRWVLVASASSPSARKACFRASTFEIRLHSTPCTG